MAAIQVGLPWPISIQMQCSMSVAELGKLFDFASGLILAPGEKQFMVTAGTMRLFLAVQFIIVCLLAYIITSMARRKTPPVLDTTTDIADTTTDIADKAIDRESALQALRTCALAQGADPRLLKVEGIPCEIVMLAGWDSPNWGN